MSPKDPKTTERSISQQNTPELSHNTSIHSIESIRFPLNTSFLDTLMRERTLGTTVGAESSRDCQGYHKAREHLTSVRQSITPMVSNRIARQCDPCPTSSRLVSASTRIRGRRTAFSPPAGDGVTTARSSRARLLPCCHYHFETRGPGAIPRLADSDRASEHLNTLPHERTT